MEQLPVILLHRSEQEHVRLAVQSAAAYNSRVFLISDSRSGYYGSQATVADIDQYGSALAKTFSEVYVHLSTNSRAFEYSCIERWFIILEFMKQHRLSRILHIDSDVLSYDNYTDVVKKYLADVDYGICIPQQEYETFYWSASGHISYWTTEALERFCHFVIEAYTQVLPTLQRKWDWHQSRQIPGGICDMTLLYFFHRNAGMRVANLLHVTPDATCFDNSINFGTNEFEAEYLTRPNRLLGRQIKAFHFKSGQPYARSQTLNRDIRFHAVHFQGGAKCLMPLYMRHQQGIRPVLERSLYRLRLWVAWVRNR